VAGASTTADGSSSTGVSGPLPTVSGDAGKKPTIAAGEGTPPTDLKVSVLTPGTGNVVAKGDHLFVNYLGQLWSGKVFDNSFDRGQAFDFDAGTGGVIPGWDEGLVGQKVGSRVLLVIPPAKGYGDQGAGSDIPPKSTLVFVVDVLGSFNATSSAIGTAVSLDDPALPKVTAEAGKKPAITMPSSAAPADLVVKTLIQGDGPAVEKGKTLVAQYVGVVWASGKQFDSSWDRGAAANFPIGVGKVIPGWDEGLVGQKVGSRVLLSIPPAKGYGSNGNTRAGIGGTDTLVFVVDILGAF
jgi:FKBP-type peptidyl-prolyl cis-trans isomerase